MVTLAISGVVADGSGSWVPVPQRIRCVRGEDMEIVLTLTKSDGSVFNPTGSTLSLAVRPKNTIGAADGTPLIARSATIVDAAAGKVKFTISSADTLDWRERKTYRYDVNLRDTALLRYQVVPESEWWLAPVVSTP